MPTTPFPHRVAFSVADYVSLKGGITLDVRTDYGALGDNVTDDGPAFRQAVADAIAVGAALRIPWSIAGYRIASFDPGYSTGSVRAAIRVAPVGATPKPFKLIGDGATITFDFSISLAYDTYGIFFDASGTVGNPGGLIANPNVGTANNSSFSTISVSGITFISKNGTTSVHAHLYFLGGFNRGTCNIAGTSVTRVTGPNWTTNMGSQPIAMGYIGPDGAASHDIWAAKMQGGIVSIATVAGVTTATLTSGPSFTSDINGTAVNANGVDTVATYVDATHVTLAGTVPATSQALLTSRILFLTHGTCDVSVGGVCTRVSGDNFDPFIGSQPVYVNGIAYLFSYTDSGHGTITPLYNPLPGALTGVVWSAGRPFFSEMAARTISLYMNNYAVASIVSAYQLTLASTPVFPSIEYSTTATILQMFPGYKILSVADASHLTLTAPAGTATSSSAWGAWLQPLTAIGDVLVENCEFHDAYNHIRGGGWNYADFSRGNRHYGASGRAGVIYNSEPHVAIWVNVDFLLSYGRVTRMGGFADCCTGVPSTITQTGLDGYCIGSGQWIIDSLVCLRHGFEAVQQNVDFGYGPLTPAGIVKNSAYNNLCLDATPALGATASNSTGIRCDASDVTGSGISIQGSPNGIFGYAVLNGIGNAAALSRNCKWSGLIVLPDSHENGVAMGGGVGALGIGGAGIVNWSFEGDVSVIGDYSGFTACDLISVGPYSINPLVLTSSRFKVAKTYAGGGLVRGLHVQQISGQIVMRGCTTDNCDIHHSLGNPSDAGDSPNLTLIDHTYLNGGQRTGGSSLAISATKHQMILNSVPSAQWVQIGQFSQTLRCRLTIESAAVGAVVEIAATGYLTAQGSPFTQLDCWQLSNPPVTQLRVSQNALNNATIILEAYVANPASLPVTFTVEPLTKQGTVLLDPPTPSLNTTALTAAINTTDTDVFITAGSGALIYPGQIYLLGSEQIAVFFKFGTNHIQANRHVNGTTAASHSIGDTLSLIQGVLSTTLTLAPGLIIDRVTLNGALATLTGRASSLPAQIASWQVASGNEADFEVVALGNNGAALRLISQRGVHSGAVNPDYDDGWVVLAKNVAGDFVVSRLVPGSASIPQFAVSGAGDASVAGALYSTNLYPSTPLAAPRGGTGGSYADFSALVAAIKTALGLGISDISGLAAALALKADSGTITTSAPSAGVAHTHTVSI
jgi:hypothetical protein